MYNEAQEIVREILERWQLGMEAVLRQCLVIRPVLMPRCRHGSRFAHSQPRGFHHHRS